MTREELFQKITTEYPGIVVEDLEEFVSSNEGSVNYDVMYIVLKARCDENFKPTVQELAEAFGLPEEVVAPIFSKMFG